MNKCMCMLFLIIFAATIATCRSWKIITRDGWEARLPKEKAFFEEPVRYVIVHHSYNPGVCRTTDACKASMRSMQTYHMDGNGWADIGYSFAVGGDGNVYIGRGFGVVGAHAPNYNNKSVGLLLIGNFMEELPPKPMMEVAQEFIAYAVEQGHVVANYTLYGHRQVRETECPGNAFYSELKNWPHWQPN